MSGPNRRRSKWIVLTAVGGAIGVGTFAATEILLQRYDPPALWEAMRADGAGVGLPSDPKPLSGAEVSLWVWPLAGGMLGVAMGTVQWFLLRRRIDRAGWWIPTNVVAWGAGSTLVGVTLSPVLAGMREVPITVWDVVPAVAGAGACMGAISGAVLVALFRRDPQVGE